jgi:pimeloyl-ACP methyl ester carboxylesterase
MIVPLASCGVCSLNATDFVVDSLRVNFPSAQIQVRTNAQTGLAEISNVDFKLEHGNGRNKMNSRQFLGKVNRVCLFGLATLLLGQVLPHTGNSVAAAQTDDREAKKGHGAPITIVEQGSFFVGGTEVTAPGKFDPAVRNTSDAGQSFPIDYMYVQYQIPQHARSFPLVMIHGANSTGSAWESTPDGREGYQTIFLRRGFAVYVVDFPRRGKAGFPSFNGTLGALLDKQIIANRTNRKSDQGTFIGLRFGPEFLEYFLNTQFPKAGLDQFFKKLIPGVMDDENVIVDALAALLEKIGPAILVSHSDSGRFAYLTAIRSPNVKGIVDYEGANQPFPVGKAPAPIPAYDGFLVGPGAPVPPEDFLKLSKIPIQIVVGDNIPSNPQPIPQLETPRIRLIFKKQFVETVNLYGGDASLLRLPDVGIYGNTHAPFLDLNNLEVADLMSEFLHEKDLDDRDH